MRSENWNWRCVFVMLLGTKSQTRVEWRPSAEWVKWDGHRGHENEFEYNGMTRHMMCHAWKTFFFWKRLRATFLSRSIGFSILTLYFKKTKHKICLLFPRSSFCSFLMMKQIRTFCSRLYVGCHLLSCSSLLFVSFLLFFVFCSFDFDLFPPFFIVLLMTTALV